MDKQMELLAVYGTLKQGQYNHTVIEQGAEFLGDASIAGWEMYSLGAFPTIVPTHDEEQTVFVEVFTVPDLRAADRLEGYPSLYNRKKVDTPYGEAWVYYMENVPKRTTIKIDSGVW
jgi:gamma-glutamylcyclotransferase (GGCT)/AIG2-like uncharacterized protein YtfP